MRKQPCCSYPNCEGYGIVTFAQVPLCPVHYMTILNETTFYYEETISYESRKHYHKISHMIPWKNKGVFTKSEGRKERPK